MRPDSSSSASGDAASTRGIIRSRSIPLWAKRPIELNATPTTGFPRRTAVNATNETVWPEKLTSALAGLPCNWTGRSTMAVSFVTRA